MQNGGCMCLALDVERSEACIADPSMLRIKQVVPTFMTSEAFMDSTIFNLGNDSNAHGGFLGQTQKQDSGALAMGIGRENITAVLPLYLFPEHWEIARRRAPPLYGLMCTLDIMGYASNQQFVIPFKVLLRAI